MDKELEKKCAGRRVLVVDDQPEIRSIVREVLADAGVRHIFEASNGRDALSFIDTDMDLVNLVICDWNMPNLSGIEFLRQLRSVESSLPFLMVTGRCDKNSVFEARAAGVTAYIRKPFSPKQLEEKIKVLIQTVN